MDKALAVKHIQETFQNSFDPGRFRYFVKNLLNSMDESKARKFHGYISDAFKPRIKTYERIASYTDPEGKKIDILIVYLKKETALERARTAQRNFVARYLKGRGEKDAGLVAFVSPDLEWRFSLVKMEYKFEKTAKGVRKVKEEFTPARRWSFLVGKNENSHTAQSCFEPILRNDKEKPTLKQLESAFSVEKVTKEFFTKYRFLFIKVKEELDGIVKKDTKIRQDFEQKGIDTVNFAKKLLGQIVFLYFLQRKGWFGVERGKKWGTGYKNFLRRLFESKHGGYNNFFNDILEPLFYDALARDRSDIDHWNDRFKCKIPFLNGGLFDPIGNYDWVNTEIVLPNELFSNQRKTKEGDIGDGILDMLDRYNFTVKEDEPLEKEVAVDPEMLGKVFENLLEVKDRKSKGTYYTPREIVHYMCRQSLINYLITETAGKVSKEDIKVLIEHGEAANENEARVVNHGKETGTYRYKIPESIRTSAGLIDKKLAEIKVCDPAIGSGAFPVGMMSEIVKARGVLSNYIKDGDRSVYSFKRHCIQSSLYGVDIDPGAVEIAKLRLWLSLIVDEEDIKTIKPLPNLDYKIMQGNSLLEEYEGIKLFDERLIASPAYDKEKEIADLKQRQSILQREYIDLHSRDKLTAVKKAELEAELKRVAEQLKQAGKEEADREDKVGLFEKQGEAAKKAAELKKLHQAYFEATHKKRKDDLKNKIDRLEWDLIEETLKERGRKTELKKLGELKTLNIKPFFLWKLNFAEVFQEKGGFDVVIANPPYLGEKGNKEIFRDIKRGFLAKYYQRKMDIFYFFFHLSLNIVKEQGVVSYITTNYFITATSASFLRHDLKDRSVIKQMINFNELKIFESARGQHNMISILLKANDNEAIAHTSMTQRRGIATSDILQNILSQSDTDTHYYSVPQKSLYDGSESYIRISGLEKDKANPTQIILEKIKKQGSPLQEFCYINMGVQSGADRVNRKLLERALAKGYVTTSYLKKHKIEIGSGIYIVNKQFLTSLSNREKKIVLPFIKNSEIQQYYVPTKYLQYYLYVDSQIDINAYPKIKAHLKKFRPILRAREQVNDDDLSWFWLRGSKREYLVNTGEHIICPYRAKFNIFAMTKGNVIGAGDIYYITKKIDSSSLKYIIALLNSKLYYFWFYHRGKRKGNTLELYQKPLSEAPIKVADTKEKQIFEDFVEQIFSITSQKDYLDNSTKQAKVREYEKQIDRMVYELYGLTEEEVKVVENS